MAIVQKTNPAEVAQVASFTTAVGRKRRRASSFIEFKTNAPSQGTFDSTSWNSPPIYPLGEPPSAKPNGAAVGELLSSARKAAEDWAYPNAPNRVVLRQEYETRMQLAIVGHRIAFHLAAGELLLAAHQQLSKMVQERSLKPLEKDPEEA
jgi:hypothetical protein